jgi:hypothetical protein
MSIYNQNTHTTKEEVLKVLNKLKKDVFDYADYNHYMEYDYNVELTLNRLDDLIEAVNMPNEKYGKNHTINKHIEDIYVPESDWVDTSDNE